MKDYQTIWAVIIIGTIVPAVYLVVVICLTRRGKEFSKMNSFFASLEGLHKALHAAFMTDIENKRADRL